MVDDQINKVVFDKSKSGKKNSEKGIIFTVTCHPKDKETGKLINNYSYFFAVTKTFGIFFHLPLRFHIAVPEK